MNQIWSFCTDVNRTVTNLTDLYRTERNWKKLNWTWFNQSWVEVNETGLNSTVPRRTLLNSLKVNLIFMYELKTEYDWAHHRLSSVQSKFSSVRFISVLHDLVPLGSIHSVQISIVQFNSLGFNQLDTLPQNSFEFHTFHLNLVRLYRDELRSVHFRSAQLSLAQTDSHPPRSVQFRSAELN